MKFTTLVSTSELAAHLDDPEWIVFDCRTTLTDPQAGRRAYAHGHIPGARYAHLDEDLSAPVSETTGRHPLPDPNVLAEKLGRWGVGADTQVVVYDDSFGAMAVRFWWLLRWLGHEKVALLDGGYPKWHNKEQRPVTDALPEIRPAAFHAAPHRALWADATQVDTARQDPHWKVLDARPEMRFTGDVEPLDPVAGHIPGSFNWPFEENLDLGGTYLPAEELREAFLNILGDIPPNRIIHSCGSGVTACHNILAMEHAGLSGSLLYPGSWSEWITDPSRPIETGETGLLCE